MIAIYMRAAARDPLSVFILLLTPALLWSLTVVSHPPLSLDLCGLLLFNTFLTLIAWLVINEIASAPQEEIEN